MSVLRRNHWLCGLLTVVALLAAWELSIRLSLIDYHLIPPVSVVFLRFLTDWTKPDFHADVVATAIRLASGFFLAAVIGIPLGIAMGYWVLVYRLFALTVDVIRPIPTTALLPIAAIMVGIGNEMYVSLIFVATAIPILLASVDGVRSVDPILIGTGRTLGRST
jgi:ABC-type nitrate/sulfonate/bicarbonate transport system permease component